MYVFIQTWIAFTSALVFSETSLLRARIADEPELHRPLVVMGSLCALCVLFAALSPYSFTVNKCGFSVCLVLINVVSWIHFCRLRQQVANLRDKQLAPGLFLRAKMARQKRYMLINTFLAMHFVVDLADSLLTPYEGHKYAPCTNVISWLEAYHLLAYILIVANNVLYGWTPFLRCSRASQKVDHLDVCTEELCIPLVCA
jgi:hypothetical protein